MNLIEGTQNYREKSYPLTMQLSLLSGLGITPYPMSVASGPYFAGPMQPNSHRKDATPSISGCQLTT